ncbi:MAG: hypothetical protein KKC50_08255 [Candidatus Omnitrophica bacterium]|nr:hypothetical protein [Candidatus Omnitrophota bacterium]
MSRKKIKKTKPKASDGADNRGEPGDPSLPVKKSPKPDRTISATDGTERDLSADMGGQESAEWAAEFTVLFRESIAESWRLKWVIPRGRSILASLWEEVPGGFWISFKMVDEPLWTAGYDFSSDKVIELKNTMAGMAGARRAADVIRFLKTFELSQLEELRDLELTTGQEIFSKQYLDWSFADKAT